MKNYSKICKNLEETKNLAQKFSKIVKDEGAFVCLYGDIGSGKTAFVREFAQFFDVKQKVTSPSFVILNEYHKGILPIYHFDLYRLENEGIKTIIDELQEYSEGKIVTFVEWAEFSQDELPFERMEIQISYLDDTKRNFEFKAIGKKYEDILE